MYNFGDSNSDTGGGSAAFGPVPTPNGDNFFHKPAGRGGDGRLPVDLIAAIPECKPGFNWSEFGECQVSLPEKEPAKALGILQAISTFDIGQNDLSAGFKSMSYEQLRAFIPNIINQFTAGIQARNDIAVEFNKQLKQAVMELRTQLPQAALTYVDLYGARYGLISHDKA
ncbi:hypothetical protein AAG906_023182 [Vitis piasezkii]